MTEGRYSRIKPRFWTDEKVRSWDDDTKLLALYLLTSPHKNLLGCYILPRGYICEDLGWEGKRVNKAFTRLLAEGFIKYDEDTRLLLIPGYLKHNPIENENQAKAAARIVAELPKSPLLQDLKLSVERLGKPFLRPLLEQFPEPLPQQIAEQVKVTVEVKEKVNNTHMSCSTSRRSSRSNDKDDYPPEFEEFYGVYPRHIEKRRAFKCWQTRIKEGVSPKDLILAAKNYAQKCAAEGTEERYIKHPATFLGPSRPYEDYIRPARQPTNVPKAWHKLKRYLNNANGQDGTQTVSETVNGTVSASVVETVSEEERNADDAGRSSQAAGLYNGHLSQPGYT